MRANGIRKLFAARGAQKGLGALYFWEYGLTKDELKYVMLETFKNKFSFEGLRMQSPSDESPYAGKNTLMVCVMPKIKFHFTMNFFEEKKSLC